MQGVFGKSPKYMSLISIIANLLESCLPDHFFGNLLDHAVFGFEPSNILTIRSLFGISYVPFLKSCMYAEDLPAVAQ